MIFPLHDREELNLLCKSKRNGARDPIIIHVKLMPSDAPDRPPQQINPNPLCHVWQTAANFGVAKLTSDLTKRE